MPRRNDFQTVLVLGAGPSLIGQGSEFDGAGLQAVQTLKALGYSVISFSSNPADVMVDPDSAQSVYIEPLTVRSLTEIIAREQPQACLPTLGGRAGLKLILELERAGALPETMRVIGVGVETVATCKERARLKEALRKVDVSLPESVAVASVDAAEKAACRLGYPVVVRASHTLGGEGVSLVYNSEELRVVAGKGMPAAAGEQIIVEEALLGWQKLQAEVLRDGTGTTVVIGLIENIDPLGVHSGDAMAVIPPMTIGGDLQMRLKAKASAVVGALDIVGVANVQFAHDPLTDRLLALEINPRYTRSSALVSTATGLPVAAIATQLAAGLTLTEVRENLGGPIEFCSDDMVAVRLPRFQFERLNGAVDRLSTRMQSVGEAVGMGGTFKEALQKAVRALDAEPAELGAREDARALDELLEALSEPSGMRLFTIHSALLRGGDAEEIAGVCRIKPWFITRIKELVELEKAIHACRGRDMRPELLTQAKRDGFSDRAIASILGIGAAEVRAQRQTLGIQKTFRRLPHAPWYYGTFQGLAPEGTAPLGVRQGIMLLGGGPTRIGQGQESDYACHHAARALEESGICPLVVNCNPAAVPGLTSGRVYIEPLTHEDVLDVYQEEKPQGVIFQFGGHTAAKVALSLSRHDVRLLGTSLTSVDLAADRVRLRERITGLGIPMPACAIAHTSEEAPASAAEIGYPVLIRPLTSIDGLGIQIVHDDEMLKAFGGPWPALISRFLENAIVADVDCVSDGQDVCMPAIMEHVELAGVHAGDCAGVIPPISIPGKHGELMRTYAERIARDLKIQGLMNVQYAISDDMLYCLGMSPRSSRTVPLVAKACRIPLPQVATKIMLGKSLRDLDACASGDNRFYVKEAVFPFGAFPDVDPVLGPEMHATGMVMGNAASFGLAYHKAFEASGLRLPERGTVLISVSKRERPAVLAVARQFRGLGFDIKATRGTHRFLKGHGIDAEVVFKLHEGRPNIVDDIKNRVFGLIINTPGGKLGAYDDSYIRKAAIRFRIPYITTLSGAIAAARGIEAYCQGKAGVRSFTDTE